MQRKEIEEKKPVKIAFEQERRGPGITGNIYIEWPVWNTGELKTEKKDAGKEPNH